jgi:glutamate carboxypeptidase
LTFNIGYVAGGTVTNRVPHAAEIGVEMRAFSPTVFEEGVDSIMALNGRSTIASHNNGYPCKLSVTIERSTSPWPRNEATDRLLHIWQAAGQAVGLDVIAEQRGGLSDGNHTWHAIPTLDGLGPSGANAHCSEQSEDGSKQQEYVTVSSFIPKAILNTVAILELARMERR